MPGPSLGARIRAARALGGYDSVKELADALESGLGRTKLYAAERNEEPLKYRELADIADCCGLPIEFFSVDFRRLHEIAPNPRRVIAQELAAAVERSETRRRGNGAESPPRRQGGQRP